jgi:translation initiation factor IF-3
MRRPGGRGFRPRQRFDGPRMNERIRVPEIRVIGSDGSQLGLMAPIDALRMAKDEGYDLVEISPTAKPPVCKIMDYGKHKYEKQKKDHESKKKQVKITLKEIKLRPNTDKHDIEFKMKHVRRFLENKDKAKITIQHRGREMMHINRSREILKNIIEGLADVGEAEMQPKIEGRTLSVIIGPKA